MPRILIAGVGSIGRRHLLNLLRLGVRDILLYRTSGKPVEEWPELPVFTRLDEALDRSPDAVVVSNPTARHLEVALAAARAGRHLFIEKPLSDSWAGVEELLGLIERNGLTAMCGFDFRFDPGLCRMKRLLDGKGFGAVVSIDAQVGQYLPDWHPAEDYRTGVSARRSTGGGVILDLIHELDYATWLMGPVARLTCFADKVSSLEIETEDTAAILLRFASGAIGTVRLDYIQRYPTRTCRVVGENGTLQWDGFKNELRWRMAGDREESVFRYPRFQRNDRFIAEMKHFLRCLELKARPKSDVLSASRVLRLALEAKAEAERYNSRQTRGRKPS